MNDDLTKLEEVMRDRAADIPYFQKAPPKMLSRARRRVARNALASVVAAGIIVAAASTGLASLRTSRSIPLGSPTPSASSCTAADLRATATLQGAAGSVIGPIHVTNFSSRTCTLEGRPTLRLSTSAGRALPARVIQVPPQWQADTKPAPQDWPVVRLRPGSAAEVRVRWTNPCPQLSRPVLWRVDIGGGTLDVFGAETASPPPCNGPSAPSTLEIGPFEPSTGA